jgi:hypothetical protein
MEGDLPLFIHPVQVCHCLGQSSNNFRQQKESCLKLVFANQQGGTAMKTKRKILMSWCFPVLTLIFLVTLISGGLLLLADAQPPPFSINLLKNGDFNEVGPRGSRTEDHMQDPGGYGASAAQHWTLFANNARPGLYIKTELRPSTLIRGSKMIYVETNAERNGLVQVFRPQGTGPKHVIACVWVKVDHGTVGIGIGDGGNVHWDTILDNPGRGWEVMRAYNGQSPANEMIIYCATPQGARFYVESASVTVAPKIDPPRPYALAEFNRLFSRLLKLCGPQ